MLPGYGFGDFVRIIELTKHTIHECKHAPREFHKANTLVVNLLGILERVKEDANKPQSVFQSDRGLVDELNRLVKPCEAPLAQLVTILAKYSSLGSSSATSIKATHRFRFPQKEVLSIQKQLSDSVETLSAFLINAGLGSIGRIEDTVNRVSRCVEHVDGSVNQIHGTVGRIESSLQTTLQVVERIAARSSGASNTAAVLSAHQAAKIPGSDSTNTLQLAAGSNGTSHERPLQSLAPVLIPCWKKRGGCFCRCHEVVDFSNRFHSLRLPSWPAIGSTCDVESCSSRRYVFSLRSALTRLGYRSAVHLEIAISGYSIMPCLKLQQVREHLSRGFKILWELEENCFLSDSDEIIPWLGPEQHQKLREQRFHNLRTLFINKTIGYHDVDPEGNTWIEKIIARPWSLELRQFQWKLLEFVCRNNGASVRKNSRLLYKTFGWIGEGPHMGLLDDLLELGLDPGAMDVQLFRKWPSFSNPNWLSERNVEDPFAIEFIRKCIEKEPGFALSDPFLEIVLVGSQDDVEKAFNKYGSPASIEFLQNAFGQSALHLSVLKPARLRFLLEKGLDPDPPDHGGTTPLMYAAAYGEAESVLSLLQHGANPGLVDKRNKRNFLIYAVLRNHWNVLEAVAEYCRRQTPETASVIQVLNYCLVAYLPKNSNRWNDITLERAFALGAEPNLIVKDENRSLLHIARWSHQCHKILDAGFTKVNAQDNDGKNVLMSTMRMGDLDLTTRLLNVLGIVINMQDNAGWTVLHHCLENMWGNIARLSDFSNPMDNSYRLDNLKMFAILESHGVDLWARDNCQCPCSPAGCPALSVLLHRSTYRGSLYGLHYTGYIFPWLIDWYLCVKATGIYENALKTVQCIRKFRVFQSFDVSHTCCEWDLIGMHPPFCERREERQSAGLFPALEEMSDDWNYDHTSVDDEWAKELAQFYTLAQQQSKNACDREISKSEPRPKPTPRKYVTVDYKRDEIIKMSDFIDTELPEPKPFDIDPRVYKAWAERCWKQGAFAKLPRGNDWWYETSCRLTSALARELEKCSL